MRRKVAPIDDLRLRGKGFAVRKVPFTSIRPDVVENHPNDRSLLYDS